MVSSAARGFLDLNQPGRATMRLILKYNVRSISRRFRQRLTGKHPAFPVISMGAKVSAPLALPVGQTLVVCLWPAGPYLAHLASHRHCNQPQSRAFTFRSGTPCGCVAAGCYPCEQISTPLWPDPKDLYTTHHESRACSSISTSIHCARVLVRSKGTRENVPGSLLRYAC